MLTKAKPSFLVDGSGRAPHQRHPERVMLRESGLDYDRLLKFFDIGFQFDVSKRFQSIDQVLTELETFFNSSTAASADAKAWPRNFEIVTSRQRGSPNGPPS
jgi:hypothetical protein